jgi:hypothetical protein
MGMKRTVNVRELDDAREFTTLEPRASTAVSARYKCPEEIPLFFAIVEDL